MRTLPNRIHVTGGSGSGTTTLGRLIAERHGHRHVDTDDIFWEATDPPYTTIRSHDERRRLLAEVLAAPGAWVISGAIGRWGYDLALEFELVIWLTPPAEARLARLSAREHADYGSRIEPGGDMHEGYEEFMRWAAAYDTADESQRSFARHERWTAELGCPVIRVDGIHPVEETLRIVETRWAELSRTR
ncbi:MAG: AAA family ATPase [Spirochaetota bacterium]